MNTTFVRIWKLGVMAFSKVQVFGREMGIVPPQLTNFALGKPTDGPRIGAGGNTDFAVDGRRTLCYFLYL